MKTKLIFGIIAAIVSVGVYLLKEDLFMATTAAGLVWIAYEKITKKEVKQDFEQKTGINYKMFKERKK
ncbi:MAG: hypothetical protein CMC13_00190 [Flavobacteriaceae bacterium]|nr:hypothetical protein [Flavobacteriaceae bacterium]|tara:strand:- start:1913 stop:2116 length:204 start_codon:yes stop_codon:yes gene_type:complete